MKKMMALLLASALTVVTMELDSQIQNSLG